MHLLRCICDTKGNVNIKLQVLPRHPLKSRILLFSPVQPARFYLFIFFFVSSSHFYYFSLCPDLFLHCALLPLLSILMASVHCRLLSPANDGSNPLPSHSSFG
uniref:Uncharacterized protein n=1 Tax=Zonotrichia albicollis TaxID=44394 RepID=A0A8D2MQS3_ZONAL